jgi:hypothetical protein
MLQLNLKKNSLSSSGCQDVKVGIRYRTGDKVETFPESLCCFKTKSKGAMSMLVVNKTSQQYQERLRVLSWNFQGYDSYKFGSYN